MKCPISQDGPGHPVSPGSNLKVVGPSAPWLPNGTINTESTRSLLLRESSDTTKTQWRTAGLPSIAVQISPRRGGTLWLVKVHLLRCGAQDIFKISLFRGSLGRQAFEISGSLALQRCLVVQSSGNLHSFVHPVCCGTSYLTRLTDELNRPNDSGVRTKCFSTPQSIDANRPILF